MGKTNMVRFKKGDKVYAIKNSAWGMEPMTVESASMVWRGDWRVISHNEAMESQDDN